ncbi:MAG: YaeQ family protein [Gammaproteobacteria bacterium]|nr:YaeQ family protein [Gammaproteobacteria bacterium]
MALNATILKVHVQIADLDRQYYHDHALTIAQHPSETDERVMVRLVAFAQHADEQLTFAKGLSDEHEPDVWKKSLIDEVELWIDLGQPDEKRIRKACGRAKHVWIYTYGGRAPQAWWNDIHNKLSRFDNLTVVYLAAEATQGLCKLIKRSMQLQCTIQENVMSLSDGTDVVDIELEYWLKSA